MKQCYTPQLCYLLLSLNIQINSAVLPTLITSMPKHKHNILYSITITVTGHALTQIWLWFPKVIVSKLSKKLMIFNSINKYYSWVHQWTNLAQTHMNMTKIHLFSPNQKSANLCANKSLKKQHLFMAANKNDFAVSNFYLRS